MKLRPEMQAETTDFYERHFEVNCMLSVYVKHPSHVIEQLGLCFAHSQEFIDLIKKICRRIAE